MYLALEVATCQPSGARISIINSGSSPSHLPSTKSPANNLIPPAKMIVMDFSAADVEADNWNPLPRGTTLAEILANSERTEPKVAEGPVLKGTNDGGCSGGDCSCFWWCSWGRQSVVQAVRVVIILPAHGFREMGLQRYLDPPRYHMSACQNPCLSLPILPTTNTLYVPLLYMPAAILNRTHRNLNPISIQS